MSLITREQWGASPRVTPAPKNITPELGGVAVHWVGGKTGLTERSDCKRDCHASVRSIQRHHMAGNGWADIAYTELVCPHENRFTGRGLRRRTAANGSSSGNQNWYAVCALVGEGDKIGHGLLDGIRESVAYLRRNGAGDGLTGHRDHFNTDCPGDELYEWLRAGMPAELGAVLTPEQMPAYPGILAVGMKGTHVQIWQRRLIRLGYTLKADGVFGLITKTETAKFQDRRDLIITGGVNAPTWRAAWPS